MLVRDWMSRNVISMDVNAAIMDALKIMKDHHIRRLPVMRNGKLVGIISDRDLKEASASDVTSLEIHELLYLMSKIKVGEIMTRDPITVAPDYTVEETAEILLNNKISGAPVVDAQGAIVGIITQTDIFRTLIALTGLSKRRGIQFGFELEDQAGSIKEAADVIRKHGGRIASILTSYDQVPAGYRRVYICVFGLDRKKIEQFKEELREKTARLLYMIDHKENKREIYE